MIDVRCTCPGKAQEIVGQVFEPHTIRLADDAPLDFTFTHKQLSKHVSLSRLRYGASVTIDTQELGDMVMVQLPLSGANAIDTGDETAALTTDHYSLLSPHQPLRQQRAADCEMLILRLQAERIREYLISRIGYAPRSPLTFMHTLQTRPGSRRRLLAAAVSYLEEEDDLHHSIELLLEQMLISIVLLEHPNSYSDFLSKPGGGATPRHVKRAEDYIRAHADQPLSTELIADAVGSTVRTLQLGFRRFRDCTPTQMMKSIRLEYAHRDLREAACGQATVTDIAYKWQFGHLSSFAQDYRQRYGEGPSATLRKHA